MKTQPVTRLSLRSHYWGVLVMVVAAGEIDESGAERLGAYLRRRQFGNDLVLDLWDVTQIDAEGVAALAEAKSRADEDGWGFAVVADLAGPCAEALAADEAAHTIAVFADRHAARAALQHSPS